MDDDYRVRITNIRQQTTASPLGQQENVLVVTYTVGPHGPFTETVSKSGFDPNALRQKLNEAAAKLKQLAQQ